MDNDKTIIQLTNRANIVSKIQKKKKNSENPTIESLRSCIGNNSADDLAESYVPFLIKATPTLMKDVFKRATSLLTSLTQLSILATDNAVTCMGEDFKHIQLFKRIHDWPLNETLVCFTYKSISASDDQDDKTFCMDIPSFNHTFRNKNSLKKLMVQMSIELSNQWNEKFDNDETIGKRHYKEDPVILDVRKSPYSKYATELVFVGTTFNHMLAKQHAYKNVTCKPQDVFFQLRYQNTKDGKPKKGMLVLSRDEWFELFNNEEFKGFCEDLWTFLPLTTDYSRRIEAYGKFIIPDNLLPDKDDQSMTEE